MEHKYPYQKMSLPTWKRAKHFQLYKDCGLPFVGMTVQMDVTALVEVCKSRKMRFFRAFMYLVMQSVAANENFRLRIDQGEVVLFETTDPSFTVMDSGDELFYIAVAEAHERFAEFEHSVTLAESRALENRRLSEKRLDLAYITCIPWLGYSELFQPLFINASDSIPRFAWGKYDKVGGGYTMPFTVFAHHGFVDGVHIARFIEDMRNRILHSDRKSVV